MGPLLLAVEQVVLVQVLDGDLVELVALLLVVREAELQYNHFTNPLSEEALKLRGSFREHHFLYQIYPPSPTA